MELEKIIFKERDVSKEPIYIEWEITKFSPIMKLLAPISLWQIGQENTVADTDIQNYVSTWRQRSYN